jgi:hypothetical protein
MCYRNEEGNDDDDDLMLDEAGEMDEEENEEELGALIDEVLDQMDVSNLEMVPCDDFDPPNPLIDRTSNHELCAIVNSNFPKHVKTEEEIGLFFQLYQEHVRNGKLDAHAFAEKWNIWILEEIRKKPDPKEFLQVYRFKTPQQIKTFKLNLEKKLTAREALHQHGNTIRMLRQMLETATDGPVSRETIGVRLTTLDTQIREESEEQQEAEQDDERTESNEAAVATIRGPTRTATLPEANRDDIDIQTIDPQLVEWALDPTVQICGACLKPRKIGDNLTTTHTSRLCLVMNRGPSEEEKKYIRKVKRKINRRHQ